jgi:hypothetical protein
MTSITISSAKVARLARTPAMLRIATALANSFDPEQKSCIAKAVIALHHNKHNP